MRHEDSAGGARRAIEAGRAFPDAAALALHCALQAHVERAPVPEASWRRAMRLLGEEARRRGIPIERLLAGLKQALASVPSARLATVADGRPAFASRLVSICIEEFYAPASREVARGLAVSREPSR